MRIDVVTLFPELFGPFLALATLEYLLVGTDWVESLLGVN